MPTADPVRTPTYTIATPPNSTGAIACLQVRALNAGAMEGFLSRAGLELPVAKPALRDLLGIDEGLAIRWDSTTLDLFPHGGVAIVSMLASALESLGFTRTDEFQYQEATDDHEQRMLSALGRAASPLAADLLLAQPDRWRAHTPGDPLADAGALDRLITPPLVAAFGPPNIGKSTLLNALAGRSVAIVADEPGTTRDHVGATLDLGGLVVRYLDTPGLLAGAAGFDADAIAIARTAVASADLVLLCGDPSTPPVSPPGDSSAAQTVLRVCLRGDLGGPEWDSLPPPDTIVSVREDSGFPHLVRTIRDTLVPPAAIADPRPWRFWGGDGSPTRA